MDVYRMNAELQYLNRNFRGQFHLDAINECLQLSVTCSTGRRYGVEIRLEGYPHTPPNILIAAPQFLYSYNGTCLNELRTSHDYHTLSPVDGYVSICYSGRNNADYCLRDLCIKAKLWLEAYEASLQKGTTINDVLT